MNTLTIKFKKKHSFKPKNIKIKEQFYTICNNIESNLTKVNPTLLMVTSLTQTKTIVNATAYLALAFSEQGKRVLVVDGNLREPSLHNLFMIDNSSGLTSLLLGEQLQHSDNTILITDYLFCLPTGEVHYEPSTLLSKETLPILAKVWKQHFDIILLHTSNSQNTPDAQIAAKYCDGIVLVIKEGKDKLEKIVSVKKQFERAKYGITGTVLIN
ncbi:CpsD/CapB family tyrosine-protein kinase [Sporosarcina sp. FSL K6-1540]|uniref:CpsD/CapB family tyrosine-protein kinase n=1 Tax=Sporosarcina sp. FSL K6-1540 TaxID=2921555 RepID=UPI00315A825F